MGAAACTCTLRASHWHVATGLAGYGPDGSDGYATFATLAEALDYARDELRFAVDHAHESAHAHGDAGDYESAWENVLACERLETLRANLDPARASAPLYRDDAAAFVALQESQAADFPHDLTGADRLYLWQCEEPSECDHVDEEEGF
jgi:hypothetical protein